MNGPRTVGALALVLAVTTAGCLGVLVGTEPLGFAAEDATASETALDQTGYREAEDASINQTRSFSVAGQNRTVELSNELHAYNRTGQIGDVDGVELGRVTVFTTPAVEIAGRTLNPIGQLSARDLATQFSGPGNETTQLEFVGNRSVRTLGSQRTVSEFETAGPTDGSQPAQSFHVATFRHGPDFVVIVASHPRRDGSERERINTIVRSLRHETES
jgi:hypothetical protein